MRLWLLRARNDLPADPEQNPWEPWYDKHFGMVVRAETELEARELAQRTAADEKYRWYRNDDGKLERTVQLAWLYTMYSTCDELAVDGNPGVILIDHART